VLGLGENMATDSTSTVLLALLAGFLVGVVFTAVKLPLPAPPALAGIMGIVGIFLGGMACQWIINRFFS